VESVRTRGYCWASWQPQVVALAPPVAVAAHPVYVLNMSVTGDTAPLETVERLREPLLVLARQIGDSIAHH
jgi:DNA-binding IclR family transcriptional regulator